MLQGLNEAFNKAKREEQENEMILESVLNAEEDYLDPEDEDDQGSQTFFQNDDGSIHIQMNGNGGSDIFV